MTQTDMMGQRAAPRVRPSDPSGLPIGARMRLRAATDAYHRRVDGELSAFDLTQVADYGRFLLVHAMALPPLEDAMTRSGLRIARPHTAPGLRSSALRADLEGLGLAPPDPVTILPVTAAEGWGVAYVLEGSRLGGRILARRVAASGRAAITANMRFLNDRGTIAWPAFVARMEAGLGSAGDLDGAIRGARMAFEAFEEALAHVRSGDRIGGSDGGRRGEGARPSGDGIGLRISNGEDFG